MANRSHAAEVVEAVDDYFDARASGLEASQIAAGTGSPSFYTGARSHRFFNRNNTTEVSVDEVPLVERREYADVLQRALVGINDVAILHNPVATRKIGGGKLHEHVFLCERRSASSSGSSRNGHLVLHLPAVVDMDAATTEIVLNEVVNLWVHAPSYADLNVRFTNVLERQPRLKQPIDHRSYDQLELDISMLTDQPHTAGRLHALRTLAPEIQRCLALARFPRPEVKHGR